MAAQSSRAEENAAVCAAILAAEDHYDVLQVPGGAKTDEIRRNYLRISVRVHPDRNQDPNATQAFQKVSEAYAVLSDEEARRTYDAEQFMSSAAGAASNAAGAAAAGAAAGAAAARRGRAGRGPPAARKRSLPFVPHFTLAHFDSLSAAEAAGDALTFEPVEFDGFKLSSRGTAVISARGG